jgi:hypothetical protein
MNKPNAYGDVKGTKERMGEMKKMVSKAKGNPIMKALAKMKK